MLNRKRTKIEEIGSKEPLLKYAARLKDEGAKAKYSAIIKGLSNNKYALAKHKIDSLRERKMLTRKSFMLVLDRVSSAQEKVEMCEARINGKGLCHLVKLEGGPLFFGALSQSGNKYLEGAYGYVVPAHISEIDKPEYAVKVMKDSDEDSHRVAQHEARYNRMMGRQCFMFEFNRKPSLVMGWQNGVPLSKLIDNEKLADYSFGQRLEWLVTLLEDVNKMHQNCYIHFDLQAKNVMVDTEAKKMTLIDFGISHRENPQEDGYEVAADMRDLAEHIIRLLFDNEWYKRHSAKTQAIHALYEASKHEVVEKRCTSLQALNYCKLLLENRKGLNREKLEGIKASTIDRKELQVEDVLRGSQRALKI
jgi:serine/threonine protein kinase